MPEWYPLMRAARVLGVPPWELLEQSEFWIHAALIMEQAEISAQRQRERQQRQQALSRD